jgi:hypothetical protein
MPLDAQADPLAAPGVTDDRGIYRLFGLSPGRYVVRASVADRRTTGVTQISDPEMDAVLARLQQRSASGATGSSGLGSRAVVTSSRADATKGAPAFGYAPIYYPDAVDPELAETVTLAEGDERDGVDLTLQLVRNSTIEGRLVSAGGLLPTSIQVTLTRSSVRERIGGAPVTSTMARPDATGTFRFTGVLPGKYRVAARAATVTPMASGSSVNPPTDVSRPATYQLSNVLWALADITVGDDDVTGLTLTLQPGLKVTGRLVFDARSLTPPESVQLRLTEQSGASAFIPGAAGRRDGTFEIDGIPAGMYGMTSPLTETGWWLRSVVVGGRDILDFPLELGPAGDVNGVVATFTDAHTELSGSLQSTTNSPASDYFVVVFSADRAFWRPASRRIRFTRPGTDGRFALRDLPAGDYLIAALTDMEPADLTEASFVESLIPGALPVHLNDGEKKTQDLRLSR